MIGTWFEQLAERGRDADMSYADAPPAAPFDLGAYTYAKRCGACQPLAATTPVVPACSA